jgi:hypothetical protein
MPIELIQTALTDDEIWSAQRTMRLQPQFPGNRKAPNCSGLFYFGFAA